MGGGVGQELVTAVTVMTGMGLFFATVLAIAYRFLRVEEDPRLDLIEGMLPGSNCGACGEAGCRAFSDQLIEGVHKPSKCTVSNQDTIDSIAAFLGSALYSGVPSRLRRTLLGGATFIAVKGVLKIYHKQHTYIRQCQRVIVDYNEFPSAASASSTSNNVGQQ